MGIYNTNPETGTYKITTRENMFWENFIFFLSKSFSCHNMAESVVKISC